MNKKTEMTQPRDIQGTALACFTFFMILGIAGTAGTAKLISLNSVFSENDWSTLPLFKAAVGMAGVDLFQTVNYYNFLTSNFAAPYKFAPALALGGGLLLGLAGVKLAWWLTKPQAAVQHLAGRQLKTGKQALKALKKEMKKEIGKGEKGVEIFPGIPISHDRETGHIIAIGGSGAGKTTVIEPIVHEAARRGDRLLIYDNKGEWTQKFDGLIFAPWDKRTVAWKISADLQNIADARNFAQALIKDSSDPMWSNAARAILTAVLVYLIREKDTWNLQDVLREIAKGYSHLRSIIYKYTPEATGLVESEEITKTAQSFLVVLSSYMSTVSDLAAAWKGKKEISIRSWLLTNKEFKNEKSRIIILQGNERYKQLEQSYIQAILTVVGSTVSSPTMEESKERKIWFIFDEIAQVGKVPTLTKMLEVGRSKGIRMVLGMQNLSQIKEVYSEHTADNWSSNVGTWFLGKSQSPSTRKFLTELCEDQKIRKYMPSFSGGGAAGQTAEQRQDAWQEVEEPVVRADEFSSLGARPHLKAVELVLLTGSDKVYKMLWPFQNTERIRKSEIPAAWTKRKRTKQVTDYHKELKQEEQQQKKPQSSGGGPAVEQEENKNDQQQEQIQDQEQEQAPAPAQETTPAPEPEPEQETAAFLSPQLEEDEPQPQEEQEQEQEQIQAQEQDQEQADKKEEVQEEAATELLEEAAGVGMATEIGEIADLMSSLTSSNKQNAAAGQQSVIIEDDEEEKEA